jgi:hypothetical protein
VLGTNIRRVWTILGLCRSCFSLRSLSLVPDLVSTSTMLRRISSNRQGPKRGNNPSGEMVPRSIRMYRSNSSSRNRIRPVSSSPVSYLIVPNAGADKQTRTSNVNIHILRYPRPRSCTRDLLVGGSEPSVRMALDPMVSNEYVSSSILLSSLSGDVDVRDRLTSSNIRSLSPYRHLRPT